MTPPPGPFLAFLTRPHQGLPPGIAARVIVTPNTVHNAAQNFGTGQEDLADAWMHLQGALDAAAGMAGNDKVADRFDARYGHAVAVAWKAFDKAIITLGGTSLGLTATANNYVRADHYSRADRPPGAPPIFAPQRVYPAMSAALPPSVIGAPDEGFGFGWEGFYSTLLAGYWPPAHIGRLRSTAKAWRAAAAEVEKVAGWLGWTINGLIDVNEGPATAAIGGFWAKVHKTGDPHTVLGGLSLLCTALGTACDQFATLTDKVRQKMIDKVGRVEAEVSLTVGTSAIIGKALGGILGTVTDTALAAVTIVVGKVLTDDVVATVDAFPTINAVEADFEAVSSTALEDEMAAAEGKTLKELGSINETAKSFNAQERKIAELLKSEGKDVKSVLESDQKGQRTYDATVDGVPTEFKSLGSDATNDTVKNALNKAKGQAGDVIVDGRGSGLTESEAQRGIARFLGANPGKVNTIRIVGDGFEIDWP